MNFFLTSLLIGCCVGKDQLRLLSYTSLPSYPDPSHASPVYQLNGGTAIDSAYDAKDHMLYVVGDESTVVHVIDLSDPSSPRLVLDHVFKPTEGKPRGIDVCGDELAIIMTSPYGGFEGHVFLYETYSDNLKQLWYLRSMPVGFDPSHVVYSSDCQTLVVSNEGRAGRSLTGHYLDPQGSVSIMKRSSSGVWVTTNVNFNSLRGRSDIRHPSVCMNRTHPVSSTSLPQDLEPVYAVFSQDEISVYVLLQENNAIAEMTVSSGAVRHVFNLGSKDWRQSGLDPSDKDGDAIILPYPIYGLYQPREMKLLTVDKKNYLVTANEGSYRKYTTHTHGVDWTEAVRASSLSADINTTTLLDFVKNDTRLGRLMVSQCDGEDPSGDRKLHTFGARGFSIWDTDNLHVPVYDSGSDIEDINQLLLDNVFNADLTSGVTSSPASLRDKASVDFGPRISTLDVLKDGGKTYMVLGSGSMGSLYLYTLHPHALHHVLREGGTHQPIRDMYRQDDAGNLGISNIRLVASADNKINKTLAIVTSNGSGSVAVYEIIPEL